MIKNQANMKHLFINIIITSIALTPFYFSWHVNAQEKPSSKQEKPSPPAGYKWQRLEEAKMSVLIPARWYLKTKNKTLPISTDSFFYAAHIVLLDQQ